MLYSPEHMHIPDGFLSIAISVVCWVITVAILGLAISRTNKSLGERQVPLMGVMAAFIFAAQMINFPIGLGTSGHLLGGALAAILLGPWGGMLVMTVVISVQGLLFQDGGLAVMGANILNMGLVTAAVGYGLYRAAQGRSHSFQMAVAALAAWLSVMAGALLTSFEIWLSGNAQVEILVPAMLFVHAFIGTGEALITVAALSFIFHTRPDLMQDEDAPSQGGRGWVLIGILIAGVVVLLSPLASTNPDGLNRVAMDLGFIQTAQSNNVSTGLLPGYEIPGIGFTPLSRILAGGVGVLIVLLGGIFLGRVIQKQRSPNQPAEASFHADAFDRYHHGNSILHTLDSRIKVILTVAIILSNVLLPDAAWPVFGLAWLFILAANLLSNLGWAFTLKRSFIALPFALAAFSVLFAMPGSPVSSFKIGMWTFTITDFGLVRYMSILIRSWLSVQAAILLVSVTEFPDIIHALAHLRLPAIFTTIVSFLYRYLFVLTDEVIRLLRARRSRSAAAAGQRSGGSVAWRARVAGHMAGQLFLRSYERSDRIYRAMQSRGYQGQLMVLHADHIHKRDWLICGLALLVLVLMQILGRL
jgi:cobalt/nickel transport system permease protein